MSASNLALSALVVVVLSWVGLTVWQQTALLRVEQMSPKIRAAADSLGEHYQARGELPPPVYWSLRDERLVEYLADEVTWTEGTGETPAGVAAPQFATVRSSSSGGERWPVWAWGLAVGYVPRLLFHGLFAGSTVWLALLWLRLRAGAV